MPGQSFRTRVFRPEDQLYLEFEFLNVVFNPPDQLNAGSVTGNGGSYLVVHFQTQNIAEQAFFETGNFEQTDEEIAAGQPTPPAVSETLPPPGYLKLRLAGRSRLVFRIPAGESVPYTVEGLLEAMSRLPLNVNPVSRYQPVLQTLVASAMLRLIQLLPTSGVATKPSPTYISYLNTLQSLILALTPPTITAPENTHTALELPYRLILSPDHRGRWDHATDPVTHDQRSELWHTRLGTSRSSGDVRVRAIWSRDFIRENLQPQDNVPFRMSLTRRDRNELVHLTSNWHIPNYVPSPTDVEHLMLTNLGAWLKLQGDWEPPPFFESQNLTVEQWRHIATMGRDQYVRVIYAGYLFPFGHRVSLVKVTERKFYPLEKKLGNIAYLFQRMFILVKEPLRSYSERDIPFRKVEIKTRVTPNLDKPEDSDLPLSTPPGQEAFWPRVVTEHGKEDFHFHMVGTDWEGRQVEFSIPLIFVSLNLDSLSSSDIVQYYNNVSITSGRRRAGIEGQSLAFAPNKEPGDTSFETDKISFGAENLSGSGPRFRPVMSQAEVDVPAVKQLLGKSAPSTITWEESFLSGFGNNIGNAGDVFVQVNDTALEFATEKTGGMVSPDISISGLSRALGPTGGKVSDMVSGNFKPQDIFSDDVELLAGIKLSDIIKNIDFFDAADTQNKIPGLTSVRVGNLIRTKYHWEISHEEFIPNNPLLVPSTNSKLSLEATVDVPLDGGEPVFSTAGEVTDFKVVLLPPAETSNVLYLVEIGFKKVKFTAGNNSKADVDVDLGAIEFKGLLEYVKKIMDYLPLDGFSDPPILDITSEGINVGYTFGFPMISIGVMSLQNIALGASVYLPFGDKPLNFHFAFCERHQPFTLTVYVFGGGGFFGIDVGLKGVVMLEAALEFGASVALNLGVAKGKASIMAGFYFQMAGSDFQFTGYFRANGSLSVLGIISVSLEFYLSLTYASKGISPHGGTLWGQAKLTVKISILFFSVSVSVSMEREFAGSDPYFWQLVEPDDWLEYCEAFDDYS